MNEDTLGSGFMPYIVDRDRAKAELRNLTAQLGWKIIINAIDARAEAVAQDLLDPASTLTEEERKLLTWRRHHWMQLRELPEILLREIELSGAVSNDINVDPFEQPDDIT